MPYITYIIHQAERGEFKQESAHFGLGPADRSFLEVGSLFPIESIVDCNPLGLVVKTSIAPPTASGACTFRALLRAFVKGTRSTGASRRYPRLRVSTIAKQLFVVRRIDRGGVGH